MFYFFPLKFSQRKGRYETETSTNNDTVQGFHRNDIPRIGELTAFHSMLHTRGKYQCFVDAYWLTLDRDPTRQALAYIHSLYIA
jgi:hypothetical protein